MTPEQQSQAELTKAVRELRDQVQFLWHAIDELREALQYAVNNREPADRQPVLHRPVKTMSLDPAAADFHVGYELPDQLQEDADRHSTVIPHDEETIAPAGSARLIDTRAAGEIPTSGGTQQGSLFAS